MGPQFFFLIGGVLKCVRNNSEGVNNAEGGHNIEGLAQSRERRERREKSFLILQGTGASNLLCSALLFFF